MPHFLIILVLVLVTTGGISPLFGQSYQAWYRAGDEAMRDADYYAALYYYEQALERRPDPAAWYAAGKAAMEFQAWEVAANYFSRVVHSSGATAFPEAPLWLSVCSMGQGLHDSAYALVQELLTTETTFTTLAQQRLQLVARSCEMIKQLDSTDQKWIVRRLGREVNTPFSDFGAYWRADSLYYSSYRFDWPKDKHRPARKQAKVMLLKGQGRGRPLGGSFNPDTLHTAHTAISADGQRLYFTVCKFSSKAAIRCQLAWRGRDRRGRWQDNYQLLPENINLSGFTATQPSLGLDTLSGIEWLFFVSDRPGGHGGLDLWKVAVPRAGETWGKPTPITQLNTPFDELTPFFHNLQQRLYFSSDGYPGMGGYDLFFASWQADSSWSAPLNLGADLNSAYNDVYLYLHDDGLSGWMSSNRPGGTWLDDRSRSCCLDIFSFSPQPPPVSSTAAEIINSNEEPPSLPPVTEAQSNDAQTFDQLSDFLPLALYFDNDEPDRRSRKLTTSQAYATTYERYVQQQPIYRTKIQQGLANDEALSATEQIDQFFEEEVKRGYQHLELFSALLLRRLEAAHRVEIFIKGYTSPRAQSDYNLALGKRRVASARLHFEQWREGVLQPYISNGQLKIAEVSFGETRAATGISDDLKDEKGSIYSPAASRERRVEIVSVREE